MTGRSGGRCTRRGGRRAGSPTTCAGRCRCGSTGSTRPATGRVGLTILPGRRDRGADAAADVARLTAERVTDVLCLLADGGLAAYGVPDLLGRYRLAGLGVRQRRSWTRASPRWRRRGRSWPGCSRGSAPGARRVHCAAGLGRAGTIAACLLRAQGASAEDAIARVAPCAGRAPWIPRNRRRSCGRSRPTRLRAIRSSARGRRGARLRGRRVFGPFADETPSAASASVSHAQGPRDPPASRSTRPPLLEVAGTTDRI